MQRILIIADGISAKHFINRIQTSYSSENRYDIVHLNDSVLPEKIPSNFTFYQFDPTSHSKLTKLLFNDYFQIIVTMENPEEAIETYKNIRHVHKQIRIVMMGDWESTFHEDNNLVFINSAELLANRLYDYLPNVPVVAQNVGMGEGEIMEVLVPFGSSYVYRHIGSIQKKQWRIVALYRKHKLIIASPSEMIQPNDLLLLVGEPHVLKSVYRVIRRQLGQFPAPFGNKLYLFIDMACKEHSYLLHMVQSALYLSGKLAKELIIRIVNPTNMQLLHAIKDVWTSHVTVVIEYERVDAGELIGKDIRHFDAGLLLLASHLFNRIHIRQTAFRAAIPVLKIGKQSLEEIEDVVTVLTANRSLEKISTTIFDVASQLELNIQLYDQNTEVMRIKEETKVHYDNLSTIFSKEIHHISSRKNPIRSLKERQNFLHCLPFEEHMLKPKIFNLLSTDVEELYYKLDAYHQLFIPS